MEWVNALIELLGSESVLLQDEQLAHYAVDKTPGHRYMPHCVVLPNASDQVGGVLAIATQYEVPVVCRGAGTGTTGGALATHGGIVLSLERLQAILDFDDVNRTIQVEPGVLTGDLQRYVEERGLFYPPDPASLDICSIGGNIAENSGGPRCLKYGVTGDYVLGLDGFFVDGTPFSFGGKLYKNVAGYDVMRLLIGSEGTLGVVTKITLRLISRPKCSELVLVAFDSYASALDALQAARASAVEPSAAEFLDGFGVESVLESYSLSFEVPERAAYLIFEVDGNLPLDLDVHMTVLIASCEQNGGSVVKRALEPHQQDEIWTLRRHTSDALKACSLSKISHDIVVPPGSVNAFMLAIEAMNTAPEWKVLGYGHLGDGNVHVNILNISCSDQEWSNVRKSLEDKIFEKTIQFDGTLTGEHGIGLTKRRYLPLMFSEQELALFQRLKQAFDPKGLLNPGKAI